MEVIDGRDNKASELQKKFGEFTTALTNLPPKLQISYCQRKSISLTPRMQGMARLNEEGKCALLASETDYIQNLNGHSGPNECIDNTAVVGKMLRQRSRYVILMHMALFGVF